MAVHFPGSFSSAIRSTGKNALREASLAWLLAAQEDASLLSWNSELRELESILRKYVDKNTPLGNFIKEKMVKSMIPEECTNWIVDSKRQFFWIRNYILIDVDSCIKAGMLPAIYATPKTQPFHLTGLDRNIAHVDFWIVRNFVDMGVAISSCKQMEVAWKKWIDLDKIFSWFDGTDAERKRKLIWNFIKKNYPEHTNGYEEFKSHEELLIFFDNPSLIKDTKELCSQKVRKDWSQQVRRENDKHRKQCNLLLPLETIEKLDKLSKKYGLSRTEIVQILIDSEHKKNVHISERLNRKLQLMSPIEQLLSPDSSHR